MGTPPYNSPTPPYTSPTPPYTSPTSPYTSPTPTTTTSYSSYYFLLLLTASESVTLSLPSFPIVNPGKVTAFPVTNVNGEYPALLTLVLCVQAAVFTNTSDIPTFLSSINFLIVKSHDA